MRKGIKVKVDECAGRMVLHDTKGKPQWKRLKGIIKIK